MKRATILPISLALGSLLLGATRKSTSGNASDSPAEVVGIADGTIARAFSLILPGRATDDNAAVHRELIDGEAGTYIGDILRERDSSLARWPARPDSPVSVWVQPNANLRDFSGEDVVRAREAFLEWNAVLLPVQFIFVADSTAADVRVTWIDHFDEPISGRTEWERDDDWMITDASIVLALHHSRGDQLDDQSVQAMALHEIGHLIGLDHTTDSLSIMAPRVRVRELSDADRATARLLYELPAGPIR